jgi:membrane associated rhomboid family serine protease
MRESSGRSSPWDRPPRGEPPAGMPTRAKIAAGVFVGLLYAVGMGLAGDWLPGIVGGALGGLLTFLVLREAEQQRRRRWKQRGG